MPTHAEKRVLSYTPDQLFDLVADIERYPDFLPWCLAARIRSRSDMIVTADLVIGFKMFRERFTSRVTLDRPGWIGVEYVEGPLRYLNNEWRFGLHDRGCELDFSVDFEFRSKVLQSLIGALFDQAFQRMVAAFEARAESLYGGSRPTPRLATRTQGV